MSGDAMWFPETFDEFVNHYSFVDHQQVYTNGTELIPVFRVKQWMDHKNANESVEYGHWETWAEKFLGVFCSVCHKLSEHKSNYCPNCGKIMRQK